MEFMQIFHNQTSKTRLDQKRRRGGGGFIRNSRDEFNKIPTRRHQVTINVNCLFFDQETRSATNILVKRVLLSFCINSNTKGVISAFATQIIKKKKGVTERI